MKTIRTSTGTFSLSGLDDAGKAKLMEIIALHRSYLIDCKIKLLELYVEYRFNKKLNRTQLHEAKRNLNGFKHAPIRQDSLALIFDQVERYSFVDLPNTIFYEEIDQRLKLFLNQLEINFTSARKTISLRKIPS